MSQITNLNVAPYYDDFDPTDNYHRVLFKPGYPVQARELTALQSILQNQIERFGQHFFKEGAKVIPGNTAYSRTYSAVELNPTFQGVPVDAYIDQLIGLKLTGQRSGITATVSSVLTSSDSERGNPTLYVSYLASSVQDNTTEAFLDGENIAASGNILSGLLGNEIIASGEPFGSTVAENATSTGSAFSIINGVYFIRGQFVNVDDETLILDQYSNTPSYRIGLYVTEEIITPDQDETLTDNSQGYNNYAAPGADRLKVSTSLFKKPLTDYNDENFVELAVVENGILRSQTTKTEYNIISDELARRTFDESGNYYVKPFDVRVKESLNDGEGNRGVLEAGQLTQGGSIPSDDLALYTISPGKAYIEGFEVETISTSTLDMPKTRTTKTIDSESIFYNTGATLELNRVYGSPLVAAGSTQTLSLRSERVGSVGGAVGAAQTEPAGDEIGVARVYDFRLESGSYSASNSDINQWNLALFDVQTVTKITLNQNTTLTTPVFVEGTASGATGFLKNSITDTNVIELYDTSGSFNKFEGFKFNGVENGRVATAITAFGISDVQSVYGKVGVGTTFAADVIQTPTAPIGVADITTVNASGESTITSTASKFPALLEVGDLVSYTSTDTAQTFTDPVFARVKTVNDSNVVVVGVTTVTGICQGRLPETAGGISVSDLKRIETQLSTSGDNTLYTPLPKTNISEVLLNDSHINIRKYAKVNITSDGELSADVTLDDNETFLPFDEERYALIRNDDGTAEVLTADKLEFNSTNTTLQIRNLSGADTGAQLIYSVKKVKPTSKAKRKNRVNSVVVNNSKLIGSGVGATTLNNGLTYGNYPYGTRVEDERISLNVPDIIGIHAIYESLDTDEASAPTTTLTLLTGATGKTGDLLIGESFTGATSGAKAIVAEKISDSKISFVRKNEFNFEEGETLVFEETGIQGVIVNLDEPSVDISENFKFDSGQRSSFFGHGAIKRKSGIDAPSKQLKIYFINGYFEESDSGDVVTANSYEGFDYTKEIRQIDGYRNTDILDSRPSVTGYSVSEGSRSPFEFYGRTFNRVGNFSNVLVSDDPLDISYSFYLGRIDRIFITKDGQLLVKYGEPSENPEPPGGSDDALEIASSEIPPYVYSTNEISLDFLKYKRFRMDDIAKLEQRIKNLEYYTTLSLLETNTSNFFIPDEEGLNRFKSGFFVDNFTSLQPQEGSVGFNNSLDMPNKTLRPRHYTTSTDLIQGPVGFTPSTDLQFAQPEGINVRKSETEIITLDYADVEWLSQTFATRSESVTPFLVSFWQGTLEITPATDTWVDTVRLEPKIIETEGNYAETMNRLQDEQGVDPQTGFGPVIWNAWETNWTGQEVIETTKRRKIAPPKHVDVQGAGGRLRRRDFTRTVTSKVVEDTFREVVDTGVMTRDGVRTVVTEQFDMESVGDRVVSRDVIPYMRSRNISFHAKKLKPLTRLYAFFDGQDVTKFCVPKLIEISMTSGTFQVGETVVGRPASTGIQRTVLDGPAINFRVAQANHREGAYDSPERTYRENPYNSQPLSQDYSSTSSVLNVDTFSLSNQPQGDFFGYAATGMTLVGQTSGAQATITNVRLISDIAANLQGSFFIPDPNNTSNPRFEAGTKVLTFVNDENNNQDDASTICEEGYTASGTLETVQENIISVRNAKIENKREFDERAVSRTTGVQKIGTETISSTKVQQKVTLWYDPLAQSFLVDDETGVFLTKCDIFFRSKDDTDVPVTLQLRTMKGGLPTQKILPFSEVVLDPDQVNVSADGTVATTFEFHAPVFLEASTEYAICVASQSTKYSVYISRVGENDLLTDTFISNQPYLGSLFKSQNASTWEPSQWEDLKFTLYRADFVDGGSVEFYNPSLKEGNNQVASLRPDAIKTNSKQIRVALSTDFNDPDLTFGNTVLQVGSNATADVVGTAGTATGTLSVVNAGIGYTGPFTYTGVALTAVTGNGRDLTADIQVTSNGTIGFATVNTSGGTPGGNGYQSGDVLGITTIGTNNLGSGARLSVTGIGRSSELLLSNVQGDFVIGVANTIQFINNSGVTTTLNYDGGSALGPWPSPTEITTINDGTHIVVNHKNHGMYVGAGNSVVLSGIRPDIKPTKLTAAYSATDTGTISVESGTNFQSFENVGVAATNTGYLLIGDEIVGYTTATGGSIGGTITRGSDPKDYPVGTPVYKYELGGVSLRRINKAHDLSEATVSEPIGYDYYNVKIDMSLDGVDRTAASGWPKLFMNATKSTGGNLIKATQNIPYEIITPNVSNVTPQGTSITATMRTVTGRSLSGVEVPFVDRGFEPVALNRPNYLNAPRLIASDVNATNNLTDIPGGKSLNLTVQMSTTDSRLSPSIDAQRVSAIYTSHRINNVVEDFALDPRVKTLDNDPSAFQYVSQEMTLENGATSLKILTSAHMNPYTDIRAFFAIGNDRGFAPIFTPFPGYTNLNDRGEIINLQDSDGRSDKYVEIIQKPRGQRAPDTFQEFTFTRDNLPTFKHFRVKLVLTSTSQAHPAALRDLRVIALA
jgi:hypothetical protein